MAARHDERIVSATLFASQVDFTYAGDLKVFVDEEQIEALEKRMSERGYLESKSMATVFNLLRSNDLLWPYVINNYLKGKAPFPFDLLYWNSDATRMPAANHSFYLRNCYLENKLAKGKMVLGNTPIDLKAVKVPIYNLATREDHIAPAKSVMVGSKLFGGDVKFVVSGSGHIAGVINPPAKQKYQFWTGPKPRNADIEGWLAKAKEHPGSWWPDWLVWLTRQSPTEVAGADSGRRRAQGNRGCAGKLREGAGLAVRSLRVSDKRRSNPGTAEVCVRAGLLGPADLAMTTSATETAPPAPAPSSRESRASGSCSAPLDRMRPWSGCRARRR